MNMKHLKALGLGGVTVIAFLAFTGTALATIVTSPAGTQLGAGAVIKAELVGKAVMHGSFADVTCGKASGEGKMTNAGSSTTTAAGEIFLGTFSECNFPVKVLNTGTSEVHTEGTSANGNGTLTSSGAEVQVETSVGNCVFTTKGTDLGKVIGGTPAKVVMNAIIPRTGGNFLCGSSGNFTAELVVTSPGTIFID
jgi:hypothetical protein